MDGRLILLTLMVFVTPGTAQINITATGCNSTKLCVGIPNGCDPGNTTCLFASVAQVSNTTNTTTFSLALKGQSSGYITLQIREPPMNISVFTCGHNASANGSFYSSWNSTTMQVMNPQGSVDADVIQCTFNITIGNSLFNISWFNLTLGSVSLNLSSTAATPTNGTMSAPTNGTTAAPTNGTTSGNTTTKKPTGASVALHPCAVLLLLSLITLSNLLKL